MSNYIPVSIFLSCVPVCSQICKHFCVYIYLMYAYVFLETSIVKLTGMPQ